MKWIITFLIVSIIPARFLSAQSENDGVRIFRKHSAPVKALAFSSDGEILATGGDDKAIYFWNVKTGELKGSIKNYFNIFCYYFQNYELLRKSRLLILNKSRYFS